MHAVEFGPAGERGFWKCSRPVQDRIREALRKLCNSPHSGKALHGELEGFYRLRVGGYRIIYKVLNAEQKIIVRAVGPRGDIY